MNLTRKQQLVLGAINDYPAAANDDALLLSIIWKREGFDEKFLTSGLYKALKYVTRPETISRRRRELFNMGLIEYTTTALETRTDAFKSELERTSAVSWLHD